MDRYTSKLILLTLVLFLASGCSAYRNAGMQGASDVGSVVGTVVGLPIGAAIVAIDETFKTADGVTKQKRPYEHNGNYTSSNNE